MAAEGGVEDTPVEPGALWEELSEDAPSFDFFQAVRLLERLRPDRAPVGGFGDPGAEVVSFAAHRGLSFPASEIQVLEAGQDGGPARMTVNFMGLTGPTGVLPYHYTQLLIERGRAGDDGLGDFLDLFHHRIVSLF